MPKRGRVLIWPSVLDDDPNEKDDRTDHQALPVEAGKKYGANAWLHMRDFKVRASRRISFVLILFLWTNIMCFFNSKISSPFRFRMHCIEVARRQSCGRFISSYILSSSFETFLLPQLHREGLTRMP